MLRRAIPTEWDTRIPFCMMAYHMIPHSAIGENPYFTIHGLDPVFPSEIISNGGVSWYARYNAMKKYKSAILPAVAEVHEGDGVQ